MINDYEATQPITTDAHIPGRSDNDEVISTLNGLIETCKDGQTGFQEAAEGTERSDLKSFFSENALQRAKFAGELQTLVQSLGGDPENSGSFAGALHRGWMNIKSAVTGRDEAAILNECERGEDSAKNAYQEALEQTLPDYIRDAVVVQHQFIVAAHDQVKALRDAANNSKSTTATSNR
jgi:uncharacterized protein (TIGR02284 family)